MSENEQEEQKETGRLIADEVGKVCEEYNLDTALFMSIDPDTHDAIVWYRGHRQHVGKLAATFVRMIKKELLKDLEL